MVYAAIKNDGDNYAILLWMRFSHVFLLILVHCVILFSLSGQVYSAGQTLDLNGSSNYHIRFDGSQNSSRLGLQYRSNVADIDGNGQSDIAVCELSASYNGTDSGSCYIIYDSILSQQTGTGNILDMSESSSYSIRYDGPSGSKLGYSSGPALVDVNGNGLVDLLIPASSATYAGSRSGSFFVIFDDLLAEHAASGGTIDLSSSDTFSIRYDCGISLPCEISESLLDGVDIDGNGKSDLVAAAGHCGAHSRARSGCLIVIYDSLLDDYTSTGNTVTLGDSDTYNLLFYEDAGSYFTNTNSFQVADVNDNGRPDIVTGGGFLDHNSRNESGSVYIIYDSIIDNYSGTNNDIDLLQDSNYNIRLDGPSASAYFGYTFLAAENVIGGEKRDIIAGAFNLGNNSRAASGSVYIISDSLIDSFSGTGNTADLSSNQNYTLRIDGPVANAQIGYGNTNQTDINNNGTVDIIISASGESNNSRATSGSVYVLYDSLLTSYDGPGDTLDLADSNNYSLRFDGPAAGDQFGWVGYAKDVNNDYQKDMLFSAYNFDGSGKTDNGGLWILYSFPHNIVPDNSSLETVRSRPTLAGSITAQQALSTISSVFYQVDSNAPGGLWTECSSTDGLFNSRTESFSCSMPVLQKGNHTVYFRALDSFGIYTAQSQYASVSVNRLQSASGRSKSNSGNPQLMRRADGYNNGGVVEPVVTNSTLLSDQNVVVITDEGVFMFDAVLTDTIHTAANLFLYVNKNTKRNISVVGDGKGILTLLSQNIRYWQVGDIHELWFTDFYNDAKILPTVQLKNSIISLSYQDDYLNMQNNSKRLNESNLVLAHSSDGFMWQILSNTIVDRDNNTVSVLHKPHGYYMIMAFTDQRKLLTDIRHTVKKNTQSANGQDSNAVENNVPKRMDYKDQDVSDKNVLIRIWRTIKSLSSYNDKRP